MRVVPNFADLREGFEAAEVGGTYYVNLPTQFRRIVERAGAGTWPKLQPPGGDEALFAGTENHYTTAADDKIAASALQRVRA